MADAYTYLTDSERVTFDETSRLMQLSDWTSWDADCKAWFDTTQQWIRDQRAYIYDLAEGNKPSGNGPGWDVAHRRERYDYLHKANHSDAKPGPGALAVLPTDALVTVEQMYVSLREMWWIATKGTSSEQSARRQACTDWLVARRQFVYRCAEGTAKDDPNAAPNGYAWDVPAQAGWDSNNRRQRYSNLQIATKHGSAYEEWCETHNPTTGQPLGDGDEGTGGSGSSSARDRALSWMSSHRGCYESPGGSNCDSRSDGIRAAQDRCVAMGSSGTWLRNQPWCGVWCANAMQAAGVKNLSYNLASVEWIEARAKAGQAPFTGWTTDPAKVRAGDLVTLFSPGQHVAMVRTPGTNPVTEEGNTSDTSAQRTRSKGDVVGYALVAYPT
jgi:hypothetical protein